MLGLTPDTLSAGVCMRVAVAGPWPARPRTGHRVAGRCRRVTEEYRRGVRFVWPSTRAGRCCTRAARGLFSSACSRWECAVPRRSTRAPNTVAMRGWLIRP